jgi:hypothetical protein
MKGRKNGKVVLTVCWEEWRKNAAVTERGGGGGEGKRKKRQGEGERVSVLYNTEFTHACFFLQYKHVNII